MNKLSYEKIYSFNKTNLGNLLLLVAILIEVYWYLSLASVGFDMTDEGFAMNWIENPFEYKTGSSFFGYIYYPIYKILNENIVYLRIFNFSVIFILSFILLKIILEKDKLLFKFQTLIVSLLVAFSSMNLYNFNFNFTPNYNSLNYIGILISSIGLVNITYCNKENFFNWTLIILGVFITILAKLPSGILLSVFIFFILLFNNNLNIKKIVYITIIAIVLFLIFILSIDGTIHNFINRIVEGIYRRNLLSGNEEITSILSIDYRWNNSDLFWKSLFFTSIIMVITKYFFTFFSQKFYFLFEILISCSFIILTLCTILSFLNFNLGINNPGLIMFSSFIAATIIGLVNINKFQINRNKVILVTYFLILPHIFAIGSSNLNWEMASIASYFFLVSAVLVLMYLNIKDLYQSLIIISVFCNLLTLSIGNAAIENPYRQSTSLKNQSTILKIDKVDNLYVDKTTSDFLVSVKNTFQDHDFNSKEPIIDLTGYSPGIIFMLDGISFGTPWYLGGYPGSDEYVTRVLKSIDCKTIMKAWLIVEKEGPRSIDLSILSELGISYPLDYELIGSAIVPKNYGGFNFERKQLYYKPKKDNDNILICQ